MNKSKSDTTLVFEGQRIPANGLILSFRRKVFEKMLFSDFKQSNDGQIEINKIHTFNHLKQYLNIQIGERQVFEENMINLMAINV